MICDMNEKYIINNRDKLENLIEKYNFIAWNIFIAD